MTRTLALLIVAALPLSACSSVQMPTPTTPHLRAQEDCPSCGIAPAPVNVNEFWAWSDVQGAPQVWAYGAERWNGAVHEVYVSPVSQPLDAPVEPPDSVVGGVWFDRPLACLNTPAQGTLRLINRAPTLQTTLPAPAISLSSRAAAESVCLNEFGPGWTPLSSGAPATLDQEVMWHQPGFWVAGYRPVQVGTEW